MCLKKPKLCTFGDRTLAYSVAKVQSCFYPGDLVTRTGDWEIRSISGRVGMYVISNSNWTEWSTIQGVIERVISKLAEHEARGRFEITRNKVNCTK